MSSRIENLCEKNDYLIATEGWADVLAQVLSLGGSGSGGGVLTLLRRHISQRASPHHRQLKQSGQGCFFKRFSGGR